MAYQVLVADDSATMRKVIELTFARENVSLTQVESAAAALERARQMRPDLALVDISLEDSDGYALCRSLKSDPNTAQIPVILMGSKQTAFDESRATQSGAAGHVIKPFETNVLIQRVMSVLAAEAPTRVTTAATAATERQAVAAAVPAVAAKPVITAAPIIIPKRPVAAGARPIAGAPPAVARHAPPPAARPTAAGKPTVTPIDTIPLWAPPSATPAAAAAPTMTTLTASARSAGPIPSAAGAPPPPTMVVKTVTPAAAQLPDRHEDPFGLRLGMQPARAPTPTPTPTPAGAAEPTFLDALAGLPIKPPPPIDEGEGIEFAPGPELEEAALEEARFEEVAIEEAGFDEAALEEPGFEEVPLEEPPFEEVAREAPAFAQPESETAVQPDVFEEFMGRQVPDATLESISAWSTDPHLRIAPTPSAGDGAEFGGAEPSGVIISEPGDEGVAETDFGEPALSSFAPEPSLSETATTAIAIAAAGKVGVPAVPFGGATPAFGAPAPNTNELTHGFVHEVVDQSVAAVAGEALRGLPAELVKKIAVDVIERVAWDIVPQIAQLVVQQHLDRLLKDKGPTILPQNPAR